MLQVEGQNFMPLPVVPTVPLGSPVWVQRLEGGRHSTVCRWHDSRERHRLLRRAATSEIPGNLHLPRGQSNHEENVVKDQTQNGPHFHTKEVGGSQYVLVSPLELLPDRLFLTIRSRVHARFLQHVSAHG
jgi:hypothetical protein